MRLISSILKSMLISGTCLLVISCSCSDKAGVKGNGDLTAPEVAGTNPTKFKTKVPLNTSLSVTFNEVMAGQSIHAGTFYLKNENNQRVDGAVNSSGKVASFKPATTLQSFARYTATLERQITDINGNRLIQDFQWLFTTGNEIDNTPPEITSVIPGENETEVSVNSDVTVSFSEYIDYESVTASTFRLQDNSGNPVSGSLETNASQVKFTSDSPLKFATQYTLTLTTGIKDTAGNSLESSYINYFTTSSVPDVIGPFVVNTYPKSDASDIATNSSISLTFNETLGSNVTNSSMIVVTTESGQPISGLISTRDNVLIFNPSTELSTLTRYTVTLNPEITDVQGNTMATKFSWHFTTGNGADTTAPSISYILPEAGTTGVANNNAITVTFSEVIDPTTLGITKFTVRANGDYLNGSVTYSGATAIFKPKGAMTNSTQHEVTIASGVSDLAGNVTSENYSWNFTTGTARDSDIPRVSSVYPLPGATDFASNSALIVRFTEAMSPVTLTPKSFYLKDTSGTVVSGTVITTGASASFRPLEILKFSEPYTAFLTTDIEDLAENALAEIYSWNFTTTSEQDTTSPSVISTVPASASQQAAVNRGVIASFSEAMDAESINLQNFYVTDADGKRVTGTITVTEDTAIFKPSKDFEYTKTYIANLLTDITDTAGNQLNQVLSWSFTTSSVPDLVPPEVVRTIPMQNSLAAVNNKISIQFSEAMNTSSINAATVLLTDTNGNSIAATVNAAQQHAYIKPITQLEFDTNYRVIVNTGIKDLANNKLATTFILNFKTSLHPDLAPPFVVSTTPYDAEDNVHITTIPSVLFSEAIDCTTLTAGSTDFQLLAGSTPVDGSIQCSGDTLTLTPASALATQTDFVLQLSTSIADLSGDNLEATFQSNFTTSPWTQQTGTAFSEQTIALGHDTAGNIISTGFTQGNFGGVNKGSADIFVSKHDKNSLLQWTKQYGSSSDDSVTASVIDNSNNIYLTGYTYGSLASANQGDADLFVMKLSSNGDLVWQQQLGSSVDDAANAIAIDQAGNLLVAAYSLANFDGHSNTGQHDIVLIKLDSDGNRLWSQQYGSLDNDIPTAVSTDSENNIYLSGYTLGDLQGNTSQGDADIFISKLDSNGNHTWTKTIGSFFDDRVQNITIDSADNVVVSGFSLGGLNGETNAGSADMVVAKYNNSGNLLWLQQLGTAFDDRAYDLALNNDDSIIVAGYTAGSMQGTNAGKFDVALHKLDSNGNLDWTTQTGSNQDDVAFAVTIDNTQNIYLSGYTTGNLDNNENLGQQDMMVMKFNSSGIKQ